MRRAIGFLVASGILARASTARTESAGCPSAGRPWVEILLEVAPPDRLIADAVEQHLRSDLGDRAIDVCTAPSSATDKPIARVHLVVTRLPSGAVFARIGVFDQVTEKSVERTIQLTRLPVDTRPAIVGAATDELLRASWAELSMSDAPPPAMAPPAAVLRAVAASLHPPVVTSSAKRPRSSVELGVELEGSSYLGHREAVGGGASLAWWFRDRVAATAGLGAEFGLARTSVHGAARIDDYNIGLGVAYALTPTERRVGLRVELDARVLYVAIGSSPNVGARGYGGSGITALGSVGARGWCDVGRVRLTLGLALRVPVRDIRALDDGATTVTSIAGVGLATNLGAVLRF